MGYEQFTKATTFRALVDVVGDLTDLVRKEMRLAQAELAANLTTKLKGGTWIGAGAGLAAAALFLVLQSAVFGIASYGIAMHWSCLIVAGGTMMVAIGAFLIGRDDARTTLTPKRALHQIQQELIVNKEQLL